MHVTISLEHFRTLRAGDLIVWRGKYLRTVTKGPADSGDTRKVPSIEFPIRRRSWRARIDTMYNYNDVKDKIALVGKRIGSLMLPSEWKALEGAGFNVRCELRRELTDKTETAERMGRPLCSAYPLLVRLIDGLTSKLSK